LALLDGARSAQRLFAGAAAQARVFPSPARRSPKAKSTAGRQTQLRLRRVVGAAALARERRAVAEVHLVLASVLTKQLSAAARRRWLAAAIKARHGARDRRRRVQKTRISAPITAASAN